jgi:hypothetical protein
MAKPVQAAQPTFSLEMLRQIVATPEARELFTAMMREAGHSAKAVDTTEAMDKACVAAFKRAGYKAEDIRPRETIKTYNLWIADGRKVRQGESSVRVKHLRLFHISQTQPLNAVEKKQALAALAEKRAKRTSDVLPKPSPLPAASSAAPTPRKGSKVLIEAGNA